MKPFTSGDWHAWKGTAHVILSNEGSKELRYFDCADDCINWLFTNGQKQVARSLNAHIRSI